MLKISSALGDTFASNEKICQSNGGHLAKILNSFDNSLVQAYLQRCKSFLFEKFAYIA